MAAADFHASGASMQQALDGALASIDRMLEAEAKSKAMILYAENWVYAPAIQKEREIIEKTGAQVLWMHGEEAHSGSHSKAYGFWRLNGGGALIGKGVHPLTAALYLKRVEGRARHGRPIRPAAVSARMHSLTRLEGLRRPRLPAHRLPRHRGFLRHPRGVRGRHGGRHLRLRDRHGRHPQLARGDGQQPPRRVQHQPEHGDADLQPGRGQFRDIYVVEKIGTKQGWAPTAPDEDFITGFPQEVEAFYRSVATGERPESDSRLAADCISTVYSAYLSAERKGAEVPVRAY